MNSPAALAQLYWPLCAGSQAHPFAPIWKEVAAPSTSLLPPLLAHLLITQDAVKERGEITTVM